MCLYSITLWLNLQATAPANVKFKDGELKRWLRTGFSDKLPRKIIERKDKMGFPVPLNLWLKRGGVARELIGDIFSSQQARTRPYLNDGISLDSILDSKHLRSQCMGFVKSRILAPTIH